MHSVLGLVQTKCMVFNVNVTNYTTLTQPRLSLRQKNETEA